MNDDRLTTRQRKFVRALIRTLEPTEAAMQSYRCKDRKVARVIASQLLTKLNISMADLMDKCGLGLERDIADLIRLRNAKITKFFTYKGQIVDKREYEDNITQFKALELSMKLKGIFRDGAVDDNSNNCQRIIIQRPDLEERLAEARERLNAIMT
jgi:hypothetical protein